MRALVGWLLALAVSGAHAAGWEVRTLRSEGRDPASFPLVAGPSQAVADRINAVLFLDVLEAAPPRAGATKLVVPTRGAMAPVTPSGFQLLRLDARVLSIAVHAEGCGAYCEDFERTFVFDLADGHRVTEAELLAPAGRMQLARKGWQAFGAAIGAELRKKAPRSVSEDDRETLRMIYEECRGRVRERARSGDLPRTLRVGKAGAEIVFERCSNHAMRALDDLGDFTWRVPAAEFDAALSAYGRALLLGDGDGRASGDPTGQAWSGTVGTAPVRLYTGPLEVDASLGGTYFYERFRKPITLSGRYAAGTWSMTEEGEDGAASGTWALKRDGLGWSGTWTGTDGRMLPVRLAP